MNQVILISGASSGLGKELALQLHEKGAIVYGTSRHPEKYNFPFRMIQLDLEIPASIEQAVKTVIEESGQLDALVNNAGIGIAGPLEHQTIVNMDKVWQTNVAGSLLLAKYVTPHLRQNGGGKIINISSLAGALGLPYRSLYSASKAALDLLSDSWRMELLPFNIQSTSIWCGDMQTPIAAKRLQDVDLDDATYAESYLRVYQAIDDDVDSGLPISEAAQQIVKIIEKKQLKRRYIVAKPLQKLAVMAKRILPHRAFDQLINTFSKL